MNIYLINSLSILAGIFSCNLILDYTKRMERMERYYTIQLTYLCERLAESSKKYNELELVYKQEINGKIIPDETVNSLHEESFDEKESLQEEALQEEALQEEALHEEALQEEALQEEAFDEVEALQEEALQEEALQEEALQEEAFYEVEALQEEALQEEALQEEALQEEAFEEIENEYVTTTPELNLKEFVQFYLFGT